MRQNYGRFRYHLFSVKENQPIQIDEIIRAGSLGHGTAVPGDFDLDLVIYSRGEHTCSTKKTGQPQT